MTPVTANAAGTKLCRENNYSFRLDVHREQLFTPETPHKRLQMSLDVKRKDVFTSLIRLRQHARWSAEPWYLPLLFCFSNLGVRGVSSAPLLWKSSVFKQVKMIVFGTFPCSLFPPASPDPWKITFHAATNEVVLSGFCSHLWLKGSLLSNVTTRYHCWWGWASANGGAAHKHKNTSLRTKTHLHLSLRSAGKTLAHI